MKNYLLGLLAVPLMSPLLSFANAQDFSFTSDGRTEYSPSSFYTDGGVFSNFAGTPSSNTSSSLTLFGSLGELCTISNYLESPEYNENSCDGLTLEAGNYTLDFMDYPFTSASFSINSSSGGSDSESGLPGLSVPDSFTSGMTQLVENFGGTIANWIPTVLLIALGITAIFALFRVVRGYAKSAFKG